MTNRQLDRHFEKAICLFCKIQFRVEFSCLQVDINNEEVLEQKAGPRKDLIVPKNKNKKYYSKLPGKNMNLANEGLPDEKDLSGEGDSFLFFVRNANFAKHALGA